MNQFLWMPVTLLLLGSCSGKEEKASPKVLVKTEKAAGHAAGSEWEMRFQHPNLIFLDIHLTDGDAFDLLSAVHPASAIIFTTAYDRYAIRAFSVNSIDYILKPVDEEHLSNAIRKYESLYGQKWLRSEQYMETLLDALMLFGS